MIIIQRKSFLYKLLALLPIQASPYLLQNIRVGSDYTTFVAVILRKF